MAKIAVDIALLPPEEVMDRAIAVNKTLIAEKQSIFLNKSDCLPHVTLAMGVMESGKIPALAVQIVALADQFYPIELLQKEVRGSEIASGINFQRTPDVQGLHQAIMHIIEPYFTYEATLEMFISPPPIDRFPPTFVRGFLGKHSHANYNPHLTLGLGKPVAPPPQFNFTANRLALCHLGTYCTCRKILFEAKLTG